MTPSAKRQAIALLVAEHCLPVRRACQAVRLTRAAWYRPPPAPLVRDAAVIEALTEVVAQNPRWGFWKCVGRLRLLGHPWNAKRVYRVYCALRLNLPRRTKRRPPQRERQPLEAPAVLNHTWALDFMHDRLYDGRPFRTLNVLDEGNREGLAIEIATSLPSWRVVAVLEELVAIHGTPTALRLDYGREFCGRPLAHPYELYCAVQQVEHRTTKVRSPQTNGFCERFHRTLKEEFFAVALRKKFYGSVQELQAEMDEWLRFYNEARSHQGYRTQGRTPWQAFQDGVQAMREAAMEPIAA